MTKVHVVKAFPATAYWEDIAPEGKWWSASDHMGYHGIEFRMVGFTGVRATGRWSLTVHDSNSVTRHKQGGSVEQGAGGFVNEQATMIYSGPRRPKADTLDVGPGDWVVLEGADLVVEIYDGGRWVGPKVRVVKAPEATADYSAAIATYNAECMRRAR